MCFDAASAAAFAAGEGGGALAALLDEVLADMRPLREQVEHGQTVGNFGTKAQAILAGVKKSGAGEEMSKAVDGMLQSLYLQQLAILRQQVLAASDKPGVAAVHLARAEEQFLTAASELMRPGSAWSCEPERYALRAALEGSYRREASLAQEEALAAQAQQSTIEVIGKLQSQMEALQSRVQGMRAGSPWFMSTSYRIPKTPITLIGRYQQGRGNIELNLSADKDPANADAGFVEGVGPANVGIGLNVGA